jgi:hypothetical protein
MKVGGAITTAMTGIQRGLSSAENNAARIANADQFNGDSPSALAESLIGLKQDRLQVQASTKVLKGVDEMIGSLFDDSA